MTKHFLNIRKFSLVTRLAVLTRRTQLKSLHKVRFEAVARAVEITNRDS